MPTIWFDPRIGKYKLDRCYYQGWCGGTFKFVAYNAGSWQCIKCKNIVPPLPGNLDTSNIYDLRWDGKKWFFLKQKKLR